MDRVSGNFHLHIDGCNAYEFRLSKTEGSKAVFSVGAQSKNDGGSYGKQEITVFLSPRQKEALVDAVVASDNNYVSRDDFDAAHAHINELRQELAKAKSKASVNICQHVTLGGQRFWAWMDSDGTGAHFHNGPHGYEEYKSFYPDPHKDKALAWLVEQAYKVGRMHEKEGR